MQTNITHVCAQSMTITHMRMKQDLTGKRSIADHTSEKEGGVRPGGQEAGPISSDLLLNFFSPRTFFLPSSSRARRKFRNAIQPRKKGPRPGLTTYLQLQAGRCVNFRVIDHEPTLYSDAHVCAPCNLISKRVFPCRTFAMHRPLPSFFPRSNEYCSQETCSRIRTLTKSVSVCCNGKHMIVRIY
jgi:hypothetical protein